MTAEELVRHNALATKELFPNEVHAFPPTEHEESVCLWKSSILNDMRGAKGTPEGTKVSSNVLVQLAAIQPSLLARIPQAGPMTSNSIESSNSIEATTTSMASTSTSTLNLNSKSSPSTAMTMNAMPVSLLSEPSLDMMPMDLVNVVDGATTTMRRGTATHQLPRPEPHARWKLMRVISGHTGWVRALAVDVTNDWFVSGAGDRTIKIWDLASGRLKVTLTGHIAPVRGLAVSDRHPYLFSAGEDKQVKCWDLEQNKVVRHYHGHLQGIYSLALHPTLDLLVTAGRDAVARVWDVRSRQPVFTLAGHSSTIYSVATQAACPHIITASMDSTVRLWSLGTGRALTTLTHHKRSVRALALHPREFTFVCGGAQDSLKKFLFPRGEFLHNFKPLRAKPQAALLAAVPSVLARADKIVNCMAVNEDNVLVTGSDQGVLEFYDYRSGQAFQRLESPPQLGSLDSEAAIFAMTFDRTGLRLITAEADKTIKIWRELSSSEELSKEDD